MAKLATGPGFCMRRNWDCQCDYCGGQFDGSNWNCNCCGKIACLEKQKAEWRRRSDLRKAAKMMSAAKQDNRTSS